MKKIILLLLILISSFALVACNSKQEITIEQLKHELKTFKLPKDQVLVVKSKQTREERIEDILNKADVNINYHTNFTDSTSIESTIVQKLTGHKTNSKSKEKYRVFTNFETIYVDGRNRNTDYYEQKFDYNPNTYNMLFEGVQNDRIMSVDLLSQLAENPFTKIYFSNKKITVSVKLTNELLINQSPYANYLFDFLGIPRLTEKQELIRFDYKIEFTYKGNDLISSIEKLTYHSKDKEGNSYLKITKNETSKYQEKLPKVFKYSHFEQK